MKRILNLFVALFALLVLAAPVQAAEPDEFKYQPNGETCANARSEQSLAEDWGTKLPKHLSKTLEKCNKYAKKAAAKKQPPTKTSTSQGQVYTSQGPQARVRSTQARVRSSFVAFAFPYLFAPTHMAQHGATLDI